MLIFSQFTKFKYFPPKNSLLHFEIFSFSLKFLTQKSDFFSVKPHNRKIFFFNLTEIQKGANYV